MGAGPGMLRSAWRCWPRTCGSCLGAPAGRAPGAGRRGRRGAVLLRSSFFVCFRFRFSSSSALLSSISSLSPMPFRSIFPSPTRSARKKARNLPSPIHSPSSRGPATRGRRRKSSARRRGRSSASAAPCPPGTGSWRRSSSFGPWSGGRRCCQTTVAEEEQAFFIVFELGGCAAKLVFFFSVPRRRRRRKNRESKTK